MVFVSSDRSPADMAAYMNEAHGNWLAVPHGSPAAQQLKAQFQACNLPLLVFLRPDGNVNARNGCSIVGLGPEQDLFDKLAGRPTVPEPGTEQETGSDPARRLDKAERLANFRGFRM